MKTVLVVEDDKNIANSLKVRLGSMGYRAIAANDAVYAMDVYNKHQPDIVLLDINLPGGNGFLVAERIRNSAPLNLPTLVFISASKKPEYKKRAAEMGAVFLEKPFEAQALTMAIQGSVNKYGDD